MKKNILFIAVNYPPSQVIADIRSFNLVKSLKNNGDNIDVLTVDQNYFIRNEIGSGRALKDVDVIRIKYWLRLEGMNIKPNEGIPKYIRRILLKLLPFFGFDFIWFWQKNAIIEIKKRNKKYDIVIATGPPFSSFNLARKLSKHMKSKLVLDYRDLWSLSPHDDDKKIISQKLREKYVIKNSSLISFVSPSMQKIMEKEFSFPTSIVITNGYNREDFEGITPIESKKYVISYVGNFYLPKRTIDPIFNALKILKLTKNEIFKKIQFIYCGGYGNYIADKSLEYGINEIVYNKHFVPREEAFKVVKGSNLSIVITTVYSKGGYADKSIITGKIFESLGMNTKILCLSPTGSDVRKVIWNNKIGYNVSGPEIERIVDIITYDFNSSEDSGTLENDGKYSWHVIGHNYANQISRLDSINKLG